MRLIFTFLTFVLIIVSTLNLGAQERYWVNGDGNWNDNSHWAETSGGEGGASVPELEDLVIFDKKSGNPEVSVNGIFFSQSIDFQSKAKFVYANNSKIYSNELVNNSNLRNENGEISLLKSDDTKAVFSVVCSRVDETCPGYCDGSITVDVDFGTPNFPVTLILNADNSCATADQSLVINSFPYTFSNICGCGAAYSIIAIDSDNFMIGCEATVVGKAPMNPFENITDESCFGVCDGQIMISIVFPIAGAPYTYDWSPNGFTGDGTNTYSDLCDGDYDVLLTDKDGCQETFTYTVNGPALLTISMDSTNVTCNGFCNGTSTVTANGGTPPYSYDWSPDGSTGDGTDTYSDLCPGAYSVTVTDDNGCTETDGNSITEPVVLDANIINHTDVVCGGASDGTANAAPTGGTTPYSYQWSQGTGSNTPNVTDLAGPGWTYLTVTDANLCQHVDSVYIDAPLSVVSVTVNGIIDVLCNGDCNGQATANGAGGTPPYTYLWESGETSNPALALCAGNQNVTIYDANLCPATETFVVGEPTVLTAAIGAFTNISCNGLCDGSATVNVGGGTTPYTYLWDNAEITNPSIALCVGATDVLVTDDNGCTASTTANITEPTAINVSLNTSTNISCNGICDGSATLTVSGGTAPYDFEWGNGETTNPATALCAGNTDVTVTDDNGCSVTFSVNLTEPDPIVINVLATTDVLCFGDCNGSATLGIVGGTPAYTIGWGNGESANPATALCGGNTDVTVTDANNCTATQTVNIVEPPVITIALLVSTDASCNGVCDGSATLNVGGGTPGYTYLWENGETTNPATALCAGNNDVTVTDANNCTATFSVTINEPPLLTVAVASFTDISCNGLCDGTATLNIGGGTPGYTIGWGNGESTNPATALCGGITGVTITDANNCTTSTSVTITEPAAIVVALNSSTNPLCNGDCNGTATLDVSGGTAPYTYLWDNGETTNPATALCDGITGVTVTDANSCQATFSVTLTEPAPLVVNVLSTTDVLCFGDCNGSATLDITGGTPAYSFIWGNGEITNPATGLCGGNTDVTITDANNCTATQTVNIVEPPAITIALLVSTDASCNGVCDGSATLNVGGGTPGYTYLWENGETTNPATALCAGNNDVTVTDANNCTATFSVTINEPPLLTVAVASFTDISCNGLCDGTATLNIGGGTPGYTIGWGNGESTNPATALCGGITGVTITDANNCTASTSVTITEPTAIVVALNSATNPLCNGDCNGTATLDVSGGTAPYTYLWENGETTNPATALCDGVTGVTVTDANNCTQTFSVTLTEPAPLLANISAFTDVLCFGECTGTATLNVAGGTIPYSYDWGNGETTNPATGLCAGNGVVTITDVNGCSTTANYSITEPANPLVIGLAATDITCNGENDGEIDLTVNGGTPGYTYLWSNSASSEDITGLAPNNYSVTVTDANGCRETDDIDITEPNPIVITETITNSHCLLADGQISLVITGGNGNNSFVWNPNTGAWDGTNYTGLVAGSYSVTVTDDQGCSETETYAITDEDAGTVAIINIVNNNCFGESNGQAFAQMTGGTAPFTYLWSSGGTNQLETNLPAGIICVTVTDASGCLSTGCETITEPDSIEMTAAITDVTCLGGSDGEIYLTVIGGTSPYTYLWSGGQLIEDIEFLSANTYSVVVTDANGCTNTDAFVVNEPATGINLSFVVSNVSCFGENDGAIDMTVSNGTLPYTYSWTGGLSTEDISGLAPGTYFVTVEDVNGCTASDSETITEPTEIIITPSITNPHCGLADGSISIAVTGGSGVYANHDWSPDGFTGDGTITYSNLPAGLYSVTTTDNEGCTASASIPISDEVPGTLSFINVVNNTCFGNTNGSATVQITGGDAIATYDWSPDGFTGDGTDTYSDLPAGFVNIMVTDINGCVYAGNIEITEPDSIEITGVTTDVLCFGDCNGEIDLSVIGGTIPYSFAWTGGYLSEDISGLCANTYSVTITDDNGCTNTTDFIVNEPLAPITLSLTGTDASCNGENDGTIDLSVSGGTLPLSFEWSSGILTEDLVGLIAGTYTVTVTDDNGCTASDSYTINEPTAISANATIVNSHCTLSDGSVALTVSGGAGGYSYDWSPDGFTGDGTDTYSDLPAGTYDVEITDATGCSITEAYIVTDEDAGTLSFIDVQNNPCFGNSLGQATVEITGGAGGYTYLWSVSASSQITQTAINLDANTHFVTVTDLNGCQLLGSIEITEPDELIISLTGTDILCNGECTGEIDLTVSGGTIPYGFVWSNFETTEDLTALCEGTYFVTVTDDNSCEASDNITISQPPLPIDIVLTGTDVNCFGGNDGAIDMTVSGGTAPYTFEWSNTELTEDISGLIAGIYNVTVTDANGCTAEDSYTINQPDSIEITFTISPSHCGIADGSVVAAVVGGTTAYSYDWSPDGFTGDGTDTYSDLSFGNYTIVITDANGCTASDIASVSDADVGTLNFDSIPASCYGICDGEATVNIIGGDAAASWAWGDGQNTQTATGLCAGIASVVVTDINGCGLAGTVEITQPDSIEMIFNVTNVVCFGETNGEIDLEVSGGTVPYTYSWSNTLTDEDLTGLSAGPFTVTVTDANGCTNTDGTIINEPLSPLSLVISGTTTNCYGDSTGTATATPSGGVPNYHYLWSNGDTLQTATGLPAGTHTVTVTDDYGCTIADSYTVIQPDSLYATFTDTVQVFCDGLCTGSATVTPVGGTPPYIYIWEDGQTDSTAIGLCAGIFCVTVIDANLCEFFSCIEITDTSNLLLTITDTLHPQCAGDCNGSLVAVVTGGTTPYTIEWSTGQIVNGEVSDTLVNLCPGTYYVTVYDINTCSREAMVDIIEPDTLFVNFTDSISPLCADSCNGMLTVTPIGGVSPYNYLWTTGGVDSTEINLCPGYVEVEVSDANGCIRNLNYTVSSPDPLDANFVVDTALCSNNSFDASINVLVTGGTAPYTYLWSNDSTSQSIDSLESGTYYITIIDANGCSMEDSVSTGAGIVVDALALADTIICYGDSVQLFGYGGDSIYWAPAYGLSDSLIYDPWASPLTTTMYYFTAWDSTGSCFDVDSALVFVRPQIEVLAWATDSIVLLDYSTTLNIDNFGNDGLTFLWFYSDSVEYPGVIDDPTSMNPTVTPLVTTEFYLLTTSPDGCTRIDTVKVKVIPKIIFPTGISPNGDNLNDTWEIDYIGFFEQVHITIYNRWGEKLFEYAGSGAGYEQRSNQWDGTFNGKDLPVGTYYFTIDFYNEMGTKPVTGPITIIR